MSAACKCDRCGKLYEFYPKGAKIQYNSLRRIQNTPYGIRALDDRDKSTIDLCEKCMGEFEHFMTTGGKFDD